VEPVATHAPDTETLHLLAGVVHHPVNERDQGGRLARTDHQVVIGTSDIHADDVPRSSVASDIDCVLQRISDLALRTKGARQTGHAELRDLLRGLNRYR
jgi:hypothetical protein